MDQGSDLNSVCLFAFFSSLGDFYPFPWFYISVYTWDLNYGNRWNHNSQFYISSLGFPLSSRLCIQTWHGQNWSLDILATSIFPLFFHILTMASLFNQLLEPETCWWFLTSSLPFTLSVTKSSWVNHQPICLKSIHCCHHHPGYHHLSHVLMTF